MYIMYRLKLFALALGTVAVTLCAAPQASAQISGQPDELHAIYACKAITDPKERLACYDSSVGHFEAAEINGDVITVSKSAIEKVERDAFGFNIPSLPGLGKIFGRGNEAPKTEKKKNALTAPVETGNAHGTKFKPIPSTPSVSPSTSAKPKTSKVTEVTLDIHKTTEFGYKKTRFFMTNGQVWEQIDGGKARIPKARNGRTNSAIVSKATMGSFFLRVNGKGTAIRVKRVR